MVNFEDFILFFVVGSAQEQQDQSYAASIQYQSGDKCFVSKDKSVKINIINSSFELHFVPSLDMLINVVVNFVLGSNYIYLCFGYDNV